MLSGGLDTAEEWRKMRRKRIAVLMAGLDREYQREYALGMAHEAAARDLDLCIFNCQGMSYLTSERNEKNEDVIFDLPCLRDFDGVASICYTMPSMESIHHIRQRLSEVKGLPLVTVDMAMDWGVAVSFDDQPSLRQMMVHLIHRHGCRRFALVTGPAGTPVADLRTRACMEEIASAGCELTACIDGAWKRDGGRSAADCLLKGEKRLPDAIVCCNDDMAFGVMERLREADIRVPEDVLVTGFDAKTEALGRGLTTVLRPSRDAGETTVRILAEWIAGRVPETRRAVLHTKLMLGKSCGCRMPEGVANDYVRLLCDERRLTERSLLRTANFSGALTGITSMEEAGRVIADIASSWDAGELYICVQPNYLNPETPMKEKGFPEEMLLLAAYSYGDRPGQIVFPTRSLVPVMETERDNPIALVFYPVYYQDTGLGYAALDLNHAVNFAMYPIMTLLGGALMSLRLQSAVRDYAAALEHLATHDPMTGLLNRRGFLGHTPAVYEEACRAGRCLAVIVCDMDNLKHINDCFGHQVGDEAIVRLSRALRVLEEAGMVPVHMSGDEFLAMGLVRDRDHALRLRDRLQDRIAEMNSINPWLCEISASVGLYAAVPRAEDGIERFIQCADEDMYRCKHRHKQG